MEWRTKKAKKKMDENFPPVVKSSGSFFPAEIIILSQISNVIQTFTTKKNSSSFYPWRIETEAKSEGVRK